MIPLFDPFDGKMRFKDQFHSFPFIDLLFLLFLHIFFKSNPLKTDVSR